MTTLPCILYVDDEEQNLLAFQATFRRDFRVVIALSGEEGLRALEAEPIEVIVTDQRMPKMTGIEFLERAIEKHPDPIRILLTGYSDIEAVVGAINRGQAYRYITKPWDVNELRMTLTGAVDLYRTRCRNRDLTIELQQQNVILDQKVKERTAQLQNKSEELEKSYEKVKELNTSISALSHEKQAFINLSVRDLKKPVDKISHEAKELERSLDQNKIDAARKHTNIIRTNADAVCGTLAKLTRVNEIEESTRQITPAMFDLSMLVQSVMLEYAEKAKARNINLRYTPALSNTMATLDIDATQEILDNLISNAVKVSPNGEEIDIRIAEATGGELQLSVEDRGAGFTDDERTRLFQKFVKFENKVQSGEDYGSGLGLSIVDRLTRAQHGTVNVEPARDKGTRFVVQLPRQLKVR
jgi:signal transduction histidine kinase